MTISEPDTTAVRAALDALVEALTPTEEETTEPSHLARVRAADRARTLAADVAEDVLDAAILHARQTRPAGATWAQLGEQLGISGQAVSKRAGARGISRRRMRPPNRSYTRPTGPRPDTPRPSPRLRHGHSAVQAPVTAPLNPAPERRGLTGTAFWHAQRRA